MDVHFTRGPEYFRKNLAPDLEAGQSSRSRSKSRSSVSQVRGAEKPRQRGLTFAEPLSDRRRRARLAMSHLECGLRVLHCLPYRSSES